jgi:uncharacterized membrane protein
MLTASSIGIKYYLGELIIVGSNYPLSLLGKSNRAMHEVYKGIILSYMDVSIDRTVIVVQL